MTCRLYLILLHVCIMFAIFDIWATIVHVLLLFWGWKQKVMPPSGPLLFTEGSGMLMRSDLRSMLESLPSKLRVGIAHVVQVLVYVNKSWWISWSCLNISCAQPLVNLWSVVQGDKMHLNTQWECIGNQWVKLLNSLLGIIKILVVYFQMKSFYPISRMLWNTIWATINLSIS